MTHFGAGPDWIEGMQERARSVMEDWNADLAVVGVIKQSETALSLWIVPRSNEGTLSRWDTPYGLAPRDPTAMRHDAGSPQAAGTPTAPFSDPRLYANLVGPPD